LPYHIVYHITMPRQRYILTVPVPETTQNYLKKWYERSFSSSLPIEHLHISLLHPFFLRKGVTEEQLTHSLQHLKSSEFSASMINLGIYSQKGKNILYINLGPKEKFQELYEEILHRAQALIEFDTTPFTNGKIPDFDPHISLDYDWKTTQPEKSFGNLEQKFQIIGCMLQKESAPRDWRQVAEIPLHSERD